MAAATKEFLLSVQDLTVEFGSGRNPVRALHAVSLDVGVAETVALVGESGCGKSVTALSIVRLLPEPPARYSGGRILLGGKDVLGLSGDELRGVRRKDVAYVFQEPSTSLNPVARVGDQIAESIRATGGSTSSRDEVVSLLSRVGIRDAATKASAYPHELSGGMQQRIMIAMALARRPRLLVADEPTTALDVTVQAQILALLQDLQAEFGMSILLITHNLGIVAAHAKRLYVMYAGSVVESGSTGDILASPGHPYTKALLRCVPSLDDAANRLAGIEGLVPSLEHLPSGCAFHPRCSVAQPDCYVAPPVLDIAGDRAVRCPYWRAS